MSKIGAMLKAQETGEKRHIMRTATAYTRHTTCPSVSFDIGLVYNIGVKLESTVVVADSVKSHPVAFGQTVDTAKQRILHDVFGEFVPLLREAEYAILNQDDGRAMELIRKVRQGFFSSEEVKL